MKTVKEIIESWMEEAGLKNRNETIAFHVSENNLFIVSKYPGWLIGKYGSLVDKYRRLLKSNGYDLKIHFVDLSCGYIREF